MNFKNVIVGGIVAGFAAITLNDASAQQFVSIGTGGVTGVYVENGGTGYTMSDVVTFDNSNTNGVGANAKITALGGYVSMEGITYPDNIVLEGASDHNKLIITDTDNEVYE